MIIFDKRILSHFDFIQPFIIFPIIILSHILISEASEILAFKQLIYFGAGFIVFLFFFFISDKKNREWAIPFFYWIGIILLILVEFFCAIKMGAKDGLRYHL